MKKIIVYYSLEGNTQYIADKLSDALGAGKLRLIPEKAYADKGFAKFFCGGKSAVMAEKPALKPYALDADFEEIIIGFPVWAGNITPPIRTFVSENKELLKGRRISAFACQSGSGAEKAFGKLRLNHKTCGIWDSGHSSSGSCLTASGRSIHHPDSRTPVCEES